MTLLNFRRTPLTIALLALALPGFAFAAYNDVTLTTDAVIAVGGYTLNVSGSTAAVQSIIVNAGSFSVTLVSGSSITITSPTLQQLSSDVTSDVTNNTCTGSASSISLAYSAAGTVTNVITPSATLCTTQASSGSTGGGGGGGMIVGSGPLAPGYQAPAPTTTPAIPVGASAPTPSGSPSTAAHPAAFRFTHNLQLRARYADVQQLQKFLNTHGAIVTNAGGGSPGNETDLFGALTYAALIRFQNAHAAQILAPLGLSKGTGFFGTASRQYANSLEASGF